MGETTPSENEWIVMEVLWDSAVPLTATDIIEKLKGIKDVSPKTIRVLINRLLKKGILDYTVDPHDARIYHYSAVKSKQDCLKEKSERFVKSYFNGNTLGMVATLVQNEYLTEEQLDELIDILEAGKNTKK